MDDRPPSAQVVDHCAWRTCRVRSDQRRAATRYGRRVRSMLRVVSRRPRSALHSAESSQRAREVAAQHAFAGTAAHLSLTAPAATATNAPQHAVATVFRSARGPLACRAADRGPFASGVAGACARARPILFGFIGEVNGPVPPVARCPQPNFRTYSIRTTTKFRNRPNSRARPGACRRDLHVAFARENTLPLHAHGTDERGSSRRHRRGQACLGTRYRPPSRAAVWSTDSVAQCVDARPSRVLCRIHPHARALALSLSLALCACPAPWLRSTSCQ